jgi:predicted homoserine dehydrogenase-like protein
VDQAYLINAIDSLSRFSVFQYEVETNVAEVNYDVFVFVVVDHEKMSERQKDTDTVSDESKRSSESVSRTRDR